MGDSSTANHQKIWISAPHGGSSAGQSFYSLLVITAKNGVGGGYESSKFQKLPETCKMLDSQVFEGLLTS